MRSLNPPNFFLGLLRVAAWLFWREAVSKSKSQPRKPRKPTLAYTVGAIPPELFAIIRISWYSAGRTTEVEEYQLPEDDDAMAQFHYLVGSALKQAGDVCVLTEYQPEDLGVPID